MAGTTSGIDIFFHPAPLHSSTLGDGEQTRLGIMSDQQNATPLPKISAPAARALESIGVTTLEQAAEHTQQELLALHGFGPRGIKILSEALTARGLKLRD
jgi:hypothetical protein